MSPMVSGAGIFCRNGSLPGLCMNSIIFFLSRVLCLAALSCITSCLLILCFLGFPLSGDQSLGNLRSDWHSNGSHRLFYRHYGGETGWVQISSY